MVTSGVLASVDAIFDLTGPRRFPSETLSPEEQGEALAITANLLQQGIVGVETVEVDGRPVETFAVTRLGSETLRNAAAYRETGNRFDARA